MKSFAPPILFTTIMASMLIVLTLPVSSARANSSLSSSAELYNLYCVTCHGRDGRAQTRKGRSTRARNLADGAWQDRATDERIFNVVSNGKGKMPAFGKKLSDAETDSLVQYVRSLRAKGKSKELRAER